MKTNLSIQICFTMFQIPKKKLAFKQFYIAHNYASKKINIFCGISRIHLYS